ncbi:PQQ-dependent sugar dehydrogenase [Candidatus Pelagibacter sp.]|jgi:hypothetical protein|nr:PQQ-dependent sugar dehydrogenase [Candidatus Pelagibacter sp.]|tara:strand:+ start:802 stop:2199 length:1398 start_codon:yes stop_codon:yes gene_type:complete
MKIKKTIVVNIVIIWIFTILTTIVWTYENPEKIKKLKDILKYDFSIGKLFNNIKSKNVKKNFKSSKKYFTTEIDTAYDQLILNHHTVPVYSSYGGIAELEGNIIYLSGDSDLFTLKKNNYSENFEFTLINAKKINNGKKAFIKSNEKTVGKNAEKYFGIKDILIEKFDKFENKLFFVSSLKYIELKNCYVVSIFVAEVLDVISIELSNWKEIFSSQKCLSVDLTTNPRFAAASAGGRLSKLNENSILFSVGDFYADGVNGPILSQDSSNIYGKIIEININDFSSKIFSYGHRNPQGLFIDDQKNIFSTEHGPTGGDEINLVLENSNYGWPYATYGTNYKSSDAYKKTANDNRKKWPIDKSNNSHDNYVKPLFSWGNQFGISNLIVYEGDYFNNWSKNLIVTSLATKQIVRFIYDYKRKLVLYKENIKIGKRIRDIIPLKDGKIVLLTDRGKKLNEYPEIIIIDKK